MVENDHTKKETAYKLENIVRVVSESEQMPKTHPEHGGHVSMDKLKEGLKVEYMPIGGVSTHTTVGTIKKILTHEEVVGSRQTHIKADEEHPST